MFSQILERIEILCFTICGQNALNSNYTVISMVFPTKNVALQGLQKKTGIKNITLYALFCLSNCIHLTSERIMPFCASRFITWDLFLHRSKPYVLKTRNDGGWNLLYNKYMHIWSVRILKNYILNVRIINFCFYKVECFTHYLKKYENA